MIPNTAYSFKRNIGVSGLELLRTETRQPENINHPFIDLFLQDIEWTGNFVKIPDNKVNDYKQKKITWWWGIDCRETIDGGYILHQSIIDALQTTPIIKDLATEIVADLQTMQVKELASCDFE